MRDPARIKPLLERLEKIWVEHSDQRLGQLICNAVGWDETAYDLYNMECEKVLERLESLFKKD
jgi:hypothetical protein